MVKLLLVFIIFLGIIALLVLGMMRKRKITAKEFMDVNVSKYTDIVDRHKQRN